MKVGLFIPCYIGAFFSEVGIATLQLLERLGYSVEYPLEQTCCGQPMANSGCHGDAHDTEALFARNFAGYEHIVTPSGRVRRKLCFCESPTRDARQSQKRSSEAVC